MCVHSLHATRALEPHHISESKSSGGDRTAEEGVEEEMKRG